ncbi:carboxylating nicotinate-nucleotide diphosphorylase [Chitinophaga nivalis]|uniref:nicotinate-nucleotide diphosphorylase (carboxylating) n=1 Tax=Chitinophaga nivalis TaxID=2991709 RepID=A0ABT3IUD9_9BACT|nr:carboxylating nicotinate-nucleotide diphosphorylase [Chitinophaga nivalis]MCW3462700.1 carboxylating nicotinate-nucleotide diphosphorylase [Chitinophaga nivalis]MCW3487609.1 carboxylating nicotinate-nucleotide diphosphorylase [Chitinophaga nivalis]
MLEEAALQAFIRSALAEDIGTGDHSTMACIPPTARGRAVLKIKEDGILAGMQVAAAIFKWLDMYTVFKPLKQDGDAMVAGETAFEVEAAVHTLLMGERLVLNCMQRMSGIATLTHSYVEKLKGYHTRVLDTRKTTPNFRLLEKEAVRIGGGVNHRMGLYDMVMLKDNHIDFSGGITAAVTNTVAYLKERNLPLKIEVETRNLEDVKEVLAVGQIDRIMLDNFTPADITAAMQLINGRFETEASGGITITNLEEYAKTGVDYISVGAMIHHAVSLDLSLKAVIL